MDTNVYPSILSHPAHSASSAGAGGRDLRPSRLSSRSLRQGDEPDLNADVAAGLCNFTSPVAFSASRGPAERKPGSEWASVVTHAGVSRKYCVRSDSSPPACAHAWNHLRSIGAAAHMGCKRERFDGWRLGIPGYLDGTLAVDRRFCDGPLAV